MNEVDAFPFTSGLSRREFVKLAGGGLGAMCLSSLFPLPAWAQSAGHGLLEHGPRSRYDLNFEPSPLIVKGRKAVATALNGTVPGPLVRLREGDKVDLHVTNSLEDTEHASIHWHGLLVPFPMDGVPGVNFRGIRPGETYHYRFTVRQAGTYWYHSHSAFQEQTGAYGPLVIDPKDGEPFAYDREYAVVLSDWSFTPPETIFRNINLMGGYYNFQKRTVGDFFRQVREEGLSTTVAKRKAWGQMRMMPVDLADVTGATYTYLMNGQSPDINWTALFDPGETVRLRFIDAAAMSNFDVRIPGLDMEVVMVDGKAVKPVRVHEFRIGVAETVDVLVRPREDTPFTIFAESLDRSGYARGTLSPEPNLEAPVPELRPRPVRDLEDIGMGGMIGKGGMKMGDTSSPPKATTDDIPGPIGPEPFRPEPGANVAMRVMNPRDRLAEPGIGLGNDGWKVLTYADLESAEPQPYSPEVDREMTINITANMERYLFSFDGKKFTQHPGPYLFRHRERLRLWLVNHTMMEHPIHLHGMWMQLENGRPHDRIPYKHTVLIKPGEKVSALITPIEKGDWAFHCHLLYHMEAGMFQVVRVS